MRHGQKLLNTWQDQVALKKGLGVTEARHGHQSGVRHMRDTRFDTGIVWVCSASKEETGHGHRGKDILMTGVFSPFVPQGHKSLSVVLHKARSQ